MSDFERVVTHFEAQSAFCAEFGSPFTSALLAAAAKDIRGGGPVATLVADWARNPDADALALRLAGALHAAVLTGRDADLAALYPGQQPDWRIESVWPAARDFLAREYDWAQAFLRSPPQTNETRRAIALLLGFLTFAASWRGPIDTLEIGASAGLNLNWDRFSYRTDTWRWGPQSPVVIDTEWHGPPPPPAQANIRTRAGCDLNPLDIRSEAGRLQLRSYIWADQSERLARFDAAVALAIENDTRVERADAAEWLVRKLAERAGDAATIVYHSVFLQYPPEAARNAISAALHEAGRKASAAAPLAWVRMEPEMVTDGQGHRFVIDLTTWPGGERRILGYCHPHLSSVYAL